MSGFFVNLAMLMNSYNRGSKSNSADETSSSNKTNKGGPVKKSADVEGSLFAGELQQPNSDVTQFGTIGQQFSKNGDFARPPMTDKEFNMATQAAVDYWADKSPEEALDAIDPRVGNGISMMAQMPLITLKRNPNPDQFI